MSRLIVRWFPMLCLMWLTACGGDAVVFAPTPLPPDETPVTYTHPSRAFSLVLPPNWSVYEQSLTTVATTSFAPPDSDVPLVQVAAVNLGQAIVPEDFVALMEQYQTQLRPDLPRYTEQDRTAMDDGSFRLTGIRTSPAGAPQQVNTFVQREGVLFGVMHVTLPPEAALRSQLQTLINTFALQPEQVDLPVASLAELTAPADAPLTIGSLATWTTPDGVFFITGEVVNNSDAPVSEVPVRAALLDAGGAEVAGAVDTVMGYAIEPGGFAPFSLRFGQGQPDTAQRYAIEVGSDEWQASQVRSFVPAEALQWTDETQLAANGALSVSGTVTNTRNEPVRRPRAVVTVFDERGRVVGAGFADVQKPVLQAGEESAYSIGVPELGGAAANYIVNVQALTCDGAC